MVAPKQRAALTRVTSASLPAATSRPAGSVLGDHRAPPPGARPKAHLASSPPVLIVPARLSGPAPRAGALVPVPGVPAPRDGALVPRAAIPAPRARARGGGLV